MTDKDQDQQEVLEEKLLDMNVPGFQAEFEAAEAEMLGAFTEDAIGEVDAAESVEGLQPMFLDDEGPSKDLPAFITTTNSYQLYDLKDNESVVEAMERKSKEA